MIPNAIRRSMKKTTHEEVVPTTPLMNQYYTIKKQHPDAILLFRVGDFYETFGQDAVKTAQALGIVLTKRNNGTSDTELAGFPYHSLDLYLPRLVKAGYRVAICDQLEKPSKEKKIVKRGVTDVVTPGLALDEKLLDHRANNFLASLFKLPNEIFGIGLLDVSTGEFMVSEGEIAYISKLLQSFLPSEVIMPKGQLKEFTKHFGDSFYSYGLDEWIYTEDNTRELLLNHFQVTSLKGFGIEEMGGAKVAAGAVLHYLHSSEKKELGHINAISRLANDKYVWLDRFTIRNLELINSPNVGGVPLIQVLDQSITPMGSRLMKKWITLPLISKAAIDSRLSKVSYFLYESEIADNVEIQLRQIGDLERIISKVAMGRISPREVVQLRRALDHVIPIKDILVNSGLPDLQKLGDSIHDCNSVREQISKQICEDAPNSIGKGSVIKPGFNAELDELVHLVNNSKDILLEIQQNEAEKTGITGLKIGFNNVFGYYLEVTNKYKDLGLIPNDWVRKQTLTGAERYITDELKKLETKILGAEEKILELEERLFLQLVEEIHQFIMPIQHNAQVVAQLDCILSFARTARKNRYVKPIINDTMVIDIKDGRHPVIESIMPAGESYVPNDIFLDSDSQQIMMITGPNMAGKSAVLRMTALIVLMAQMGSFVPAESATIGIVDKVFTRVGASDNISSGESTFMVEMNETANIMNNLSARSLILLDEIGRGTSTYDGISIAWSIAEFLHDHPSARPKTLFATHYHELNELENLHERIKNFHVATREANSKVIFLRKLQLGGSQHSFGIHVAKMAGMPREIILRSNEILAELEDKHIGNDQNLQNKVKNLPGNNMQLSFFDAKDEAAEELKNQLKQLNVNSMTPIDCMLKLLELQKNILEES